MKPKEPTTIQRIFPFWRFSKMELLGLVGIFFIAIFIRFLVIRNNAVFFFFDQSRDATSVYQITHGHPIKVQGPSASGTGDSMYHGVLYYYLLVPAYALGQGSPHFASMWLGIVTSLTIFPLFLLAKSISHSSKVGYLAAILFAASFEAAQMGTWLSNPGFAVLTLTCLYFFVWRIFYQNKSSELPWLAFFLGLSNQSIIYSAYVGIVLALIYFFNQNRSIGDEPVKISLKTWIVSGVVYLAATSTMIVNQALLFRHGLFNPFSTLTSMNDLGKMPLLQLLQEIFGLFLKNIQYAFIPGSAVVSLSILVIGFLALKKYPPAINQFLLIWLLAPLALLLLIFRNGYHVMIGTTPVLYLVLALAINKIQEMKLGKIVSAGIICLILVSQLIGGRAVLNKHQHLAGLQGGTLLQDELELIDETYKQAQGRSFSISTLTIPYGYNTTWAYLYHWYGQEKYGYLPSYVGSKQSGIIGEGFLTEAEKPEALHFTVQEPTQGLPEYFVKKFGGDQENLAGPQSSEILFGTLRLGVRNTPIVAKPEVMK